MDPIVRASVPAVDVAGVPIGPEHPIAVIAGPCAVESIEQFRETAHAVKEAGAVLLRGGAFKPRTSPYSFQGLGERGLEIMREVGDELRMGIVTEAMAPDQVEPVARLADMIQIGARNMDNGPLLARAARAGKPVLLKRGMAATVEEVLAAVRIIRQGGGRDVVVCERGSRTFEPSTRNSLDIVAIATFGLLHDFPIVVDPSHATGRADLVTPMGLAGIASGADGVLVEVHPHPQSALSDGPQSLEASRFMPFMQSVRSVAAAVGRAA